MSGDKSYGGALVPLVFLLFLGLKLAGVGVVAKWSWWWVCAPLWIPLAATCAVVVLCAAVVAVSAAVAGFIAWLTS